MDQKSTPPPEKSSSFSSKGNKNDNNDETPKNGRDRGCDGEQCERSEGKHPEKDPDLSVPQVLEEVDAFLHTLESNPAAEVPAPAESVVLLCILVESMIDKYNAGRYRIKFGRDPQDDTAFFLALGRIFKVSTTLATIKTNDLSSSPQAQTQAHALDKSTFILEKAMSFLENELCTLLEDPKADNNTITKSSSNSDLIQPKTQTPKRTTKKSASFSSLQDSDVIHDNESPSAPNDQDQELFPDFSADSVSVMNKIATAMISANYHIECCMAFSNFRRKAFKTVLEHGLGYGTASMEDIQRTQWESLEAQIATWNNAVRHCCTVLFPAERRLYDCVFSDQPWVSQRLFDDVSRAVIIRLLNFAEAITLTKRSGEKLFKFLDMYETLRDLEPILEGCYPEMCGGAEEVAYETVMAKGRVGVAAAGMFCDLESSIKSDNERIPVPNGAVHPLTRYVMNYLKYACEYKHSLEQVFDEQRLLVSGKNRETEAAESARKQRQQQEGKTEDGTPKNSALTVQLMTVMDLLEANLEKKSRLYRDPALRYIFLMNNGRYIVQKIKGSVEIYDCMGDNWYRRRKSGLRLYHNNYKRETWSKVLHVLSQEGLQGNSKVLKPVLKERFKVFNAMFDDIHKSQSSWVVSDEQLRSELRVSISAVVIPAYRSFVARFKHHLDYSGRQLEKYIKYQPEDIETMIDELFDGNAISMARRRT